MNFTFAGSTISVGWVIALLALIAAFMLWLIGELPPREAGFFVALAAARLL